MNFILDKEKIRDRIAEVSDELGRVYNTLIFVTTGIIAFIIFFLTRISDLSLSLEQKIPLLIKITDAGEYMMFIFLVLLIVDILFIYLIIQYKRKIKKLYNLLLERKRNLIISDFYVKEKIKS